MTQALNLANFANYLNSSGQVSNAGLQTPATTSIPSGSVVLFYQASAPTGWTQVTTLNDYDLRLVSGSGGSTGGTTAYSSVFTNQTVSTTVSVSGSTGGTTLSTGQLASHNHNVYVGPTCCATINGVYGAATTPSIQYSSAVLYTGGNGSHNHSFSGSGSGTSSAVTLNVRYANIIICSKN